MLCLILFESPAEKQRGPVESSRGPAVFQQTFDIERLAIDLQYIFTQTKDLIIKNLHMLKAS